MSERRQKAKQTAAQIKAVQKFYPKYSKAAHSLAENGALTGLMRKPDAEAIAQATKQGKSPEALQAPQRDYHKHRCRVSCRLSEDAYGLFNEARERARFDTAQECLDFIVNGFIRSMEVYADE